MNDAFKEAMMSYYDTRAPEYDEIYIGKGPASIPNSTLYKKELFSESFTEFSNLTPNSCLWILPGAKDDSNIITKKVPSKEP